MKVLFTTCFISPYRADFFNELGKTCDLTVIAEEPMEKQTHRNAKWFTDTFENFKLEYLKPHYIRNKVFCPDIVSYVKNGGFDLVVVGGCSTLTEIYSLIQLKNKGPVLLMNSDGVMETQASAWKKRLKRYLYNRPDCLLSTGAYTTAYFETLGVAREKVALYPFTSLREADLAERPATEREKQELRQRLNIPEQQMVISVGRFIPSKGYDVMLEACQGFPKSTGVYIIGGKASREYEALKEKLGLSQVHFVDFQTKEELANYYRAADLFALPTRTDVWGLVVNEAMGQGLPVVTTDHCGAGLELIEEGVEGYVVPVDDAPAMSKAMMRILSDPQRRESMSRKSLSRIRHYTIEQMARRHMEIFEHLTRENRR